MWLWLTVTSKVYWCISSIKVIDVDKILKYFLIYIMYALNAFLIVIQLFFFKHMILFFFVIFLDNCILVSPLLMFPNKETSFTGKSKIPIKKDFNLPYVIEHVSNQFYLNFSRLQLYICFLFTVFIKGQNSIFLIHFLEKKNQDYFVFLKKSPILLFCFLIKTIFVFCSCLINIPKYPQSSF